MTLNDSRTQLETARARDFYRYYHPFSQQLNTVEFSRHPKDFKNPVAAVAHDPALVAFAEVGAIRLKARRAIISFFDRQYQYVLAEACLEPEDEIWLGPGIVSRGNSCCEYTADLDPDVATHPTQSPEVVVISDLREHKLFHEKEFVVAKPYGRFYAGVPIRTPQGFNIGAYCVVDDEPRDGLTESEANLMKEMGRAVMTHLDRIRATAEQQRAGKMIRGLGNFISGRSGLEDWWCQTNRDQNDRRASEFVQGSTSRQSVMTSQPELRHAPYRSETTNTTPGDVHDKSNANISCPDSSAVPYNGVLSPEVVSTFRRAVGLVRDALDLDGALFLDASISSFGGLVETPVRQASSSNIVNNSHAHTPKTQLDTATPRKNIPGLGYFDEMRSPGRDAAPHCDVLGLAVAEGHEDQVHMRQHLLIELLDRYPRGKIWCFDESEETEPSESPPILSDTPTVESFLEQGVFREGMRSRERKALRKLFPRVRSLAFTGLWDSHRNRWFASSIIWTCDPVRVFAPENELSYLAAFGDTLMAEVARLNVKTADKAKADFISSISHELRSPLHGILGSVECLQETDMEASQADLLATVRTCGETLLDTVHHLLDHAKIQTLVKEGPASFQSASFSKSVAALESVVDLSLLTEQAVETVFAGHTFVSSNTSIVDHEKTLANGSHELQVHVSSPISIGLSFGNSSGSAWTFQTSAGAWRRIILNLIGNSLKYTEKGHIKVEVDATPLATDTDGLSSRVVLTVSDTGRGISEDFLRNQLFEPFAQEDFLMPGTGLGMSMCRQIVASLGGKIEVQSKKDKGTIVRVTADLVHAVEGDTVSVVSDAFAVAPLEEYRNLKFNLFGIDPLDRNHSMHSLLESFSQTCQAWFNMNFSCSLKPGNADIYMTTQECIADMAAMRAVCSSQRDELPALLEAPIIVLCENTSIAHSLKRNGDYRDMTNGIVTYISQPCGPRKLAKALNICGQERRSPSTTGHGAVTSRPRYGEKMSLPPCNGSSNGDVPADFSSNQGLPLLYHETQTSDLVADIVHTLPSTTKQEPHRSTDALANNISSLSNIANPTQRNNTGEPTATRSETKVLIVDDNMVNLKILETYMKKRGLQYATAVNGLQAFELYKKSASTAQSIQETGDQLTMDHIEPPSPSPIPFSWVLMDINMPVMDGFESTRQIRAFERLSDLSPAKVIALTGLASAEAQQEAFGSGVDLFLTKPVRLKELTKIMNESNSQDMEVGGAPL